MKTKEDLAIEFCKKDDQHQLYNQVKYDAFLAGYNARESQSVAQAEVSDEEVAETWYNENEFTGSNKEAFLACIQHGRASERAKMQNEIYQRTKDVGRIDKIAQQERARSAKLVGIMNRISYGLTLPEDDIQKAIRKALDEAIADYEREK